MPKFGSKKSSNGKSSKTGLAAAGLAFMIIGIILGAAGGMIAAGVISLPLGLIGGMNPDLQITINQNGGGTLQLSQGQFTIDIRNTNGSHWSYTLQQLLTGSIDRFQCVSVNPIKILCQLDRGSYSITFPASVMTSAGQYLPDKTLFSSIIVNPLSLQTITVNYTLQGGGPAPGGNNEKLTINFPSTGLASGYTIPGAGTYTDNGYGWTIYAVPNGGYRATGFVLDGASVAGYSATVDGIPCIMISIIPSASDHILTPVFAAIPVGHLTIQAADHGTTSPAPGVYADNGAGWSVDAIADQGYRLDHWVLDGANATANDPGVTTITIPTSANDHAIAPVFVLSGSGISSSLIGLSLIAIAAALELVGIAMMGVSARGMKK